MSYEVVLPPDTQNEITSFIDNNYVGRAEQMAVADIIENELRKLAETPVLGRAVCRFDVVINGRKTRPVEAAFKVLPADGLVVVYSFSTTPPIAL